MKYHKIGLKARLLPSMDGRARHRPSAAMEGPSRAGNVHRNARSNIRREEERAAGVAVPFVHFMNQWDMKPTSSRVLYAVQIVLGVVTGSYVSYYGNTYSIQHRLNQISCPRPLGDWLLGMGITIILYAIFVVVMVFIRYGYYDDLADIVVANQYYLACQYSLGLFAFVWFVCGNAWLFGFTDNTNCHNDLRQMCLVLIAYVYIHFTLQTLAILGTSVIERYRLIAVDASAGVHSSQHNSAPSQ